jgi:hypothetical protein
LITYATERITLSTVKGAAPPVSRSGRKYRLRCGQQDWHCSSDGVRLELAATLCFYFAPAATLCFSNERSAGSRVVEFKQVPPNWWPIYASIRGHFTLQVTVLKADSISGDVLRVRTKKASTDVQIPLHPDLVAALAKLEPYDGGYLFWNRRVDGAKASTPQHNFGKLLASVFANAGVATDVHHVSHALRNTFAVHLLEKGLPLETVSLMLGHQSVTTTERYYADFSENYMDRAELSVRKVWALADGETLG